jgi:hypothetical protein
MWSPAANTLAWSNNGAETMRLDSSGNLGLGATPSAWGAGVKAVQFSSGAFAGSGTSAIALGNAYFDGTNHRYLANGFAAYHAVNNGAGQHAFYVAPSGTAGNAISFTQAMTLDSSGNLGIGTTSPGAKLEVASGNVLLSNTQSYAIKTAAGATCAVVTLTSGNVLELGGGGATDSIQFWNQGLERMRLDSSGNLGIGTSSPGAKLHINSGASDEVARFEGTGEPFISLYDNGTRDFYLFDTTEIRMWGQANKAMVFATNNAERMRLDASGRLLLNQTSSGLLNSNSFALEPTNGYAVWNHPSSAVSGSFFHYFGYNAGTIGSITQSGTTAVLYNTTSDQRLKTNIVDAPDAAALIDSIKVRSFDWISDESHQRYGFVAQELVTVAPEAVHQPADPDEMMAVDYSKLVPMLVKEIQSLRARVAALEKT